MSQGGTLKLSINLSRGECTPIEPKDDQMTESNEGATGENGVFFIVKLLLILMLFRRK